jgi:MFS family permease
LILAFVVSSVLDQSEQKADGIRVAQKSPSAERATTSQRVVTRGGRLVLASLLLNSIPIGYMNVVPLVYLLEVGYSPALVGIVYSASAIANTIGLVPFGMLADRLGRKNFLMIGSFLPAASYAVFALTLDPYWLVLASALGGVGLAGGLASSMSTPAILPILSNTTGDKGRTALFAVTEGIWTLALTIGAVLSFLPAFLVSVGAFASSVQAHSASYFVMAALAASSVVPLLFLGPERRASRSRERPDAGDNPTIVAEEIEAAKLATRRWSPAAGAWLPARRF